MSVISQILQLHGSLVSLAPKSPTSLPWPHTSENLSLDMSVCGLSLSPCTIAGVPLSVGGIWISDKIYAVPSPLGTHEPVGHFLPSLSPPLLAHALVLFCFRSS